MRKIKKQNKYIMLVTLFILFFSFMMPCYSTENNLDLKTAKALALENSRSLKDMELLVQKTGVYKDEAEDAYYAKDAQKTLDGYLGEYYNLNERLAELEANNTDGINDEDIAQINQRIAALEISIATTKGKIDIGTSESLKDARRDTKNSYDDAVDAKNDFEEQLLYQVETLYINILNTEKQITLLEQNYELKNDLLIVERVKKDLGLSSQVDIDELAVEVSTLANNIKGLKNTLKVLKWQFCDMLGINLDESFVLEDFDITNAYADNSYENLLNKILNNYSKISQLERDIEKNTSDLDDEDIKDDENQKKLVEITIAEKENDLADEYIAIQTTASNLITELKTKKKDYQLAQITYDTVKQSYEWNKKKFELGMLSKLQMDAFELSYLDAVNSRKNAEYELYMAQKKVQLAENGILVSTQAY